MKKPISPLGHGVLDYGSVAFMLAAPSLLGLRGPARTLSYAFAGMYLGVSALTRMPLGLAKLIPFPVHGTIELASTPALIGLPLLLGALGTTRERLYFAGLLGTVLTAYSLTDWQAGAEAPAEGASIEMQPSPEVQAELERRYGGAERSLH